MTDLQIHIEHTLRWAQDEPAPEVDGPPEGMRRVTIDVDTYASAGPFRTAAFILGQSGLGSSSFAYASLRAIADAIDTQP